MPRWSAFEQKPIIPKGVCEVSTLFEPCGCKGRAPRSNNGCEQQQEEFY
jgi:hypothetical protein